MTAAEIISKFEGLVDDSMDQDTALALLNARKDMVEEARDWSFLMATHSPSGSSFDLPSDYKRTVSLYVGTVPYAPVPYERRSEYQSGPLPSGTIVHTYQKQTDEIGIGDSPAWPERFHKVLSFAMAASFFAVDQEERGRSWDDKWTGMAMDLYRSMVDWDVAKYRRSSESLSQAPGGLYYVDPVASRIVLLPGQAWPSDSVALGIM